MNDLVVSDVHKRLGDNQVLKGVSFTLKRGDVVALLGPSGSGKTTLLRAVAGLDHPDSGVIRLGERTLFDGAAGAAVPAEQRGLGLVFQSYALWPHRTVLQNVEYPLRVRRVPGAEMRERSPRCVDCSTLACGRPPVRSTRSGARCSAPRPGCRPDSAPG